MNQFHIFIYSLNLSKNVFQWCLLLFFSSRHSLLLAMFPHRLLLNSLIFFLLCVLLFPYYPLLTIVFYRYCCCYCFDCKGFFKKTSMINEVIVSSFWITKVLLLLEFDINFVAFIDLIYISLIRVVS